MSSRSYLLSKYKEKLKSNSTIKSAIGMHTYNTVNVWGDGNKREFKFQPNSRNNIISNMTWLDFI